MNRLATSLVLCCLAALSGCTEPRHADSGPLDAAADATDSSTKDGGATDSGVQSPRPNIVIVMFDDCAGKEDIGDLAAAYSPAFAQHLVSARVFRHLHTHTTCTPTRLALLTGLRSERHGIFQPLDSASEIGLRDDGVTIAEVLKAQGYDTAHFGKAHIGDNAEARMLGNGFDHQVTYEVLDRSANSGFLDPEISISGVGVLQATGHKSGIIADFASKWVSESARQSRPFFAYVAANCPHKPEQAPPEYRNRFPDTDAGRFKAHQVHCLDQYARVIDSAPENTLFLSFCDNGPATGNHDDATHVYRGYKRDLTQGGVGGYGYAWGAGVVPGTDDSVVSVLDLVPTVAALAGVELPTPVDGESFAAALAGGLFERQRDLFWYYAPWQSVAAGPPAVHQAQREGQWKVIQRGDTVGYYDLEVDPREENSLPLDARAQRMLEEISLWRIQDTRIPDSVALTDTRYSPVMRPFTAALTIEVTSAPTVRTALAEKLGAWGAYLETDGHVTVEFEHQGTTHALTSPQSVVKLGRTDVAFDVFPYRRSDQHMRLFVAPRSAGFPTAASRETQQEDPSRIPNLDHSTEPLVIGADVIAQRFWLAWFPVDVLAQALGR